MRTNIEIDDQLILKRNKFLRVLVGEFIILSWILLGMAVRHGYSQTTWAKSYGGWSYDYADSVQLTPDGGYIIAGFSSSFAGGANAWVFKMDAQGNIQWQKVYGGTGSDIARSAQPTPDGGYILAGGTSSFGPWGLWVLKLDGAGNVQWQKVYRGPKGGSAYSAQPTPDGGYIVGANTYSFGAGDMDFWVLKLDGAGNVEWQKTYGGAHYEEAWSIQLTSNGGYIVAGVTYSFGLYPDAWVLKLDSTGNVEWQKTYGGAHFDEALSIQQTSDGGYILAGYTCSFGAGSHDLWVVKLDKHGNIQWQKAYGGSNSDVVYSIQPTLDDGYILAGHTLSFGVGSHDLWVVKLDKHGNIQWQKTYGGPNTDVPKKLNVIQTTPEWCYIVAGYTYSFGAGLSDAWLLKLDAQGIIGSECPIIGTTSVAGVDTAALVSDTFATITSINVTTVETNATVTDTSASTSTQCFFQLMADLAVTKTDSPDPVLAGVDLTYTVSVVNNGPSNTTGVTLIDTLPVGATFISAKASQGSCGQAGGNVTCNLGTLNSANSATVTIVVRPEVRGTIMNTASVSSNEFDSNMANNMATENTMVGNTPIGTNVQISPSPNVSITFSKVTRVGNTTVATSTTNPGSEKFGFKFLGTYYDIETDATYDGPVTVCVKYNDSNIPAGKEKTLIIFHWDVNDWVDITSSLDTTNNKICGIVSSLSWFAVAYSELITATIDIDPNPINLKSRGQWITCYIELPREYNVEDIIVSSIELNDTVPAETKPTEIGDYDNDKSLDLMVKFDRAAISSILKEGDNKIVISGKLSNGIQFEGSDTVKIIK